jgi:hypothetical protein
MALYAYMQKVQRLIWDYKQQLLRPDDLTAFVNTARGRVAAESGCIRVYGSLAVTPANTQYAFSAITYSTPGIGSILNVRMLSVLQGSGVSVAMQGYPWEYFNQYYICGATATTGQPTAWAQFGQGVAGTLFIGPTPNANYTLNCDSIGLPSNLTTDASVEALPYPWTDAVAFYAAYEALLSMQKFDGAAEFYKIYKAYVQQAREMATPGVLPSQLPQTGPLVVPAPLGEMAPAQGR